MTKPKYGPELKAKVLAEYKAGATTYQLARAYGVPRATIRLWVAAQDRSVAVPEGYDLDAMAWGLVNDSFAALQAILRQAQDPEWLRQQDAQHLAYLYGITADKLVRLLAARRDDTETGGLDPDAGAAVESTAVTVRPA